MIDLMSLNGNKDYIPCPSCSQLEEIKQLLATHQTFENESPIISIDLLISEVKMWRTKEAYERKLKTTMISSMVKKMESGHENN